MAMTPAQQAASTGFWQWLSPRAHRLPELEDEASPFWDAVLGHLKEIDDGLWLEISGGDDPREIVLSASGNPDLFDLVEAIAAQAPGIPGWCVIGLKPALGFDFTTTWEGVLLDPKQLWFEALDNPALPEIVGLRVAAPGHTRARDTDYCNGVLTLLDTALGERRAAQDIHLVEVVAPPPDPDGAGYLPMVELADYLDWRRKRRISQAH